MAILKLKKTEDKIMSNWKNGPITETELAHSVSLYWDTGDNYADTQREARWRELAEEMRGSGWVLGCDGGMPGIWHPSYKFNGDPTSFIQYVKDFDSPGSYLIFIYDSEREYDFHYETPSCKNIKPLLEAFGV